LNTSRRKQVAVLVSGRGTNMTALIQAAMDPAYPAAIARVISNRPDAKALAVAENAGIATSVIDHREFEGREAHEEAVGEVLAGDEPDFICLAGYMRILTAGFVQRHQGRMLNIHPSLLPSFPGVDTHERALAAGVRIHGASVHFVTEAVDEGPVIAQAAVPVLTRDSAETLAARVLAAENRLYPHALSLVASGAARLSGGRVVFGDAQADPGDGALFSPPLGPGS
jgi:phosphoribosylglycinamide formyltransferase-1